MRTALVAIRERAAVRQLDAGLSPIRRGSVGKRWLCVQNAIYGGETNGGTGST